MLPFALLLCDLVAGRSVGLLASSNDGYSCDFDGNLTRWGCQTGAWNYSDDYPGLNIRELCLDADGNRGQTGMLKFMWWTNAPKSTQDFTIRTGDGPTNVDPTSYVPGRYLSIYIRAKKFDTFYKGLLLYAKDSSGAKVGEWILSRETSPQFSLHPTHMCTKSVMHLNAEDKPYVVKFTFVTPPAGTGVITIRAMLKTGPPNPTNWGDFLKLPILSLTEAAASTIESPGNWVLLNGTETCTGYCARVGQPPCSPASLALNLAGFQPKPFDQIYPCHGALWHDCTGNPRATVADNFCYARHAPNCPPAQPSCSAIPTAPTPLFCVCGAPITPAPTGPPTLNSGSRLNPGVATILALLTLGLFTKSQKTWISCLFLLSVVPSASAHNWLEGARGRASNLGASQFCSPTFPQLNRNAIHMQVGVNQDFVVEWAAAHGDFTYFIVIHDDARANASLLTRKFMDDWLAACPQGGFANTTATGMKYHRFRPNQNLSSIAPVNGQSASSLTYADLFKPNPIYSGPVWDSFSLGGQRPGTFFMNPGSLRYTGTANGDQIILPFNQSLFPASMLAEYEPLYLEKDRRCSYTNASHPWVETIHRYSHQDASLAFGTALLRIPARKGPGRYQVHYKWASYCDVMDVDVQQNVQLAPYGTKINVTNVVYDVGQHCFFEQPRAVGQCVEVVTNTQQCAAICNNDAGCKAYQLLPLQLDSSNGNSYGLFPDQSYVPWGKNFSRCDLKQFASAPKSGSMICFTINSFQNDLNSARPLWSFTDDTDHQGFYGTCYIKPRLVNFTNPLRLAEDTDTTFRFLSKCVPCDNIGMDPRNPRWGPQLPYCTDCAANPVPPKNATKNVPSWTLLPAGANNGTFTGRSHWLSPGGSPFAFADECRALAARDPTCSKFVMFSELRRQRAANSPNTFQVNSSVRLLLTTPVAWHFTNYSFGVSYFRNCACLDAPGPAAGNPPIDVNQTSMACAGVSSAQCVFRGFQIYKLD